MRSLVMYGALTLGCAAVGAGQSRPGTQVDYLVRTGMLFESNLDHDETPEGAYGGVVGMGFRLRDRADRPKIELGYEVAGHRYSIPAEWNRVSHLAFGAFTLRPTGRFALRTSGEASFKGSSEDRDVGNQYRLEEEISWRPFSTTTLALTAVGRLRRYATDPLRDARNGYLAGGLTQRLTRGTRIGGSARIEQNHATAARNSYDRTTYEVELRTDGPLGTLDIDGSYRRKRYGFRLVEDGDDEGRPRIDRRYQVEVDWTINPWADLDVILGYQWEQRFSNEVDKGYVAHRVGISLVRRW